MDTTPKYDHDRLVDLLAERATFERTAVELYDALLEALRDVDDQAITSSIPALERHRDEEREHAQWLDGLLRKLGGTPAHGLPDAVNTEARALMDVIRTKPNGAGLLPVFHAMLASELMDAEGWKLLLELADFFGDAAAVRQLRTRVEREDEHLALIRHLVLTLAKNSVQFGRPRDVPAKPSPRASTASTTTSARGKSSRKDVLDVDISGPARATTDHEKIRAWVEERGGKPAHVKSTGRRGDVGMLRIDFPGFSGARSLEPIDWDAWLRAFDANGLAFIYEETTAAGEPSRFNKLVSRETIMRRQAGEHDASVHKGRRNAQPRGRAQQRASSGARRTSARH